MDVGRSALVSELSSQLRIEAADKAVKCLFPAQGFVFMSFCILCKSAGGEVLHLIHLPAASNVAENSPPGTSVHKFSANLSVSVSPVIPGFPRIINSSPLTEAFRVNRLSGTDFQVVTTGKEQLDFETGPNIFDLQIYVQDDVGQDFYLVERTHPRFIYQVKAFDPEDTSRNIPLSYFLISPSKSFRMSANGNLFSTTKFDFEAGHSSYPLIVEVRDSQVLRASTALQLNIVNSTMSPRALPVYMIPEELSPGTIMANITAEDPDDKGVTSFLLYSLTTVNSYFMINQLTGTIQVAHRIDRDAGELRRNPSVALEVLVKDRPSGAQENRMQITFVVEDINDTPAACSKFTFSIMVSERAAKGTLLLDLNKFCFDDDSEAPNNQFNFTTPSGVGSSGWFLQDPAGSGKIVLVGDLDHENPSNLAGSSQHTVITQAQDKIYIYILTTPENEFPLVFDRLSYVANVSESSPARTRVGQVQATDKELPQRSIVYSISTWGASRQYPNVFWINPKTGELQLVTKVDYETIPIYILRIQATNSKDTSSVTVTVNVLEKNDEKPICTPNSYFLAIPVDLKVGTNIQNFKLTCTDLDSSPRSFRYPIGPGNINSHFTFSPNAGSNVTRLLLATRFDYTGGLDEIWDYKLVVYLTDDNLLSGRKKAEALVETRTVTLNVSVIPYPTTIVTTTPRPRVTYQILRKNVYAPSAWYVPFVSTLGSILLLGLLVSLIVFVAKAIYRHGGWYGAYSLCLLMLLLLFACSVLLYKRTPARQRIRVQSCLERKNTEREVVLETIQMNTAFDGETIDPARKWKDPLTQMPKWKESSRLGAAWSGAASGEETGLPRSTNKEEDGLSSQVQAEDAGLGSRNQDGKPSSPQSRNPALMSSASPKPNPENHSAALGGALTVGRVQLHPKFYEGRGGCAIVVKMWAEGTQIWVPKRDI
ncbi:hypothetical protein HPG69_013423 [Diceros bicornis minor]|uniref:Cadherin-related family member 3 n=1 Tax=Diceros bicornis minor TaxID=77932 RepID=A0A7J7EA60_DICBM|nr:hypothetical protein HPG69_013423 [Diceros bicornis minor]